MRLYRAFEAEGLFSPLPEWSADKRLRESEIVEGMKHQDAVLHAELKRALAAMTA